MTRRQVLLLGGLSFFAPRAALAQEPHTPLTEWVRRFYLAQLAVRASREARADAETEAGADPGLAFQFHEYLTAEMQALYQRAAAQPPKPSAAADGPILDELFGWGALPNRTIKLAAVAELPWWQSFGEKDLVRVTLEIAGTARELTLKGHYDAPTFNWEIADIDYGDETLRERLERLAE